MQSTTLHFNLAPYDRFHRELWERNLALWQTGAPPQIRLVPGADDAEFIVETLVRQSFADGRVFRVAPESHYRHRPEDTFAWDGQDLPTGRLPGLYCSLPRRIFNPSRHRSFCYPYRYNEHIAFADAADARHLFGFTGSITSPLRARLFETLAPRAAADRSLLRITEPIWSRIFTDENRSEKLRYFDDLRQCKFVLCPRGNGISSVRLFESLEAGRVPVILSDAYVPPAGIDWNTCSVQIRERDLHRTPEILAAREPEWPAMAVRARAVWEKNFGETSLLAGLAAALQSIKAARTVPERWAATFYIPRVLPQYALVKAKRLHRVLFAGRPPASVPAA
jgi:Exostosin family